MLKQMPVTALLLLPVVVYLCGCDRTESSASATGLAIAPVVVRDADAKPLVPGDGLYEEVDSEKDAELILVVDTYFPDNPVPAPFTLWLGRIKTNKEPSIETHEPGLGHGFGRLCRRRRTADSFASLRNDKFLRG